MPEFSFSKALVLGAKPLGDAKYIVSLFTKEKGRHLGVVKKKTPPMTASLLSGRWQARLLEQMGSYFIEEEVSSHLPFLEDSKRLSVISSVCFLLDTLFAERVDYDYFYQETINLIANLEKDDFQMHYVLWEIKLLEALGFALDFSKCAGGGDANDLAYVSPKSGRAVSKKMGEPYKDKLLPLPKFMYQEVFVADKDALIAGLNTTGYFLLHYAGLKQLPVLRNTIV
ncbi:MAG: DNA repair protein RecO [Alphaproteobacteria bacterium]|nr:DNA repair protein RecO [Alphaproteobacteria bacterium]